jgi:hypothetical protein
MFAFIHGSIGLHPEGVQENHPGEYRPALRRRSGKSSRDVQACTQKAFRQTIQGSIGLRSEGVQANHPKYRPALRRRSGKSSRGI